jgi:hypothetical protein
MLWPGFFQPLLGDSKQEENTQQRRSLRQSAVRLLSSLRQEEQQQLQEQPEGDEDVVIINGVPVYGRVVLTLQPPAHEDELGQETRSLQLSGKNNCARNGPGFWEFRTCNMAGRTAGVCLSVNMGCPRPTVGHFDSQTCLIFCLDPPAPPSPPLPPSAAWLPPLAPSSGST